MHRFRPRTDPNCSDDSILRRDGQEIIITRRDSGDPWVTGDDNLDIEVRFRDGVRFCVYGDEIEEGP